MRLFVPVTAIAVCFLTATAMGATRGPDWKHVAVILLAIAAAGAGARFGLAAGLGMGVIAAVTAWLAHPDLPIVPTVVELATYPAAGGAAGWFADRERKNRLRWEVAVKQLSAAHTELKDSFEAMKRAERLFSLGQLSAGLAHEIRNPLASIIGAVRILRRNQTAEPRYAECLDIIDKEAQRLNRLLTNFLDFARPRPPEFRPIDVEAAFDTVIALAAHGLGRDDIALRKQVESGLPMPECDDEQLRQVLLNLAINAIQASAEAGEVVLAARRAGDGADIILEVRDHGVGVSPEHLNYLFDPFFTTKENGTGLGLPVAHEIVRQFGGSLAATRNSDRGMTFRIVLPIRRRNPHEDADPIVAR